MARRINKFVKGGHREHRSKEGRDPHYRMKRQSRLRKKFLIDKELKDETNKHVRDPDIK